MPQYAIFLDVNSWLYVRGAWLMFNGNPMRQKKIDEYEVKRAEFWWVFYKLYPHLDRCNINISGYHTQSRERMKVFVTYKQNTSILLNEEVIQC